MAIITSLVVGGASLALAQPPDYTGRAAVSDRDHDSSVNNPQGWFSLSSHNRIDSASEIVPVHARIRWLRLEPRSGRPVIERLTVQYADGTQQDFDVGAKLRKDGITIDLHAERGVRGVIVHARPDARASYSLFGEKG